MKEIIFLVMLGCAAFVNAQKYVTIPDANFAKYLREVVPNAININQLDTSSADVKNLKAINAEARAIKNLEGVQYFIGLDTLDIGNGEGIPDNSKNQFHTLPTLPENLKVLVCGNVGLDSLSDLPKQLTILKCYGNNLSKLPTLPIHLKYLDCEINKITSLLLNNELKYVFCSKNIISTIFNFSDSLSQIDCSSNKLEYLPVTNQNLEIINCSSNQLKQLPVFYDKVVAIFCHYNELTSISELPKNLIYFNASVNKLNTINQLPKNLRILRLENNILKTLPNLPDSLNSLNIYHNNLDSLPNLPSKLKFLECSANQLNSLPQLPSTLNFLGCADNKITKIPELINTSLAILQCSNNQLYGLPELNKDLKALTCKNNQILYIPKLSNELIIFDCQGNKLKSLPVLPKNLKKLDCSDNQITCLPTLNNDLTNEWISVVYPKASFTFNFVSKGFDFKYYIDYHFQIFDDYESFGQPGFLITNNPISCLPNYISAMDVKSLSLPLCEEQDINNHSACEIGKRGVLGYTFFHDTTIANIPVVLLDENKNQLGMTYTALNGVYQFVKDSANYHVKIDTTNIPFKVVSPNGNDTLVSISKNNPFADSVNFNLTCKDGFDVGIRSVATTGIVFPGQPHTLHVSGGDMSNWFGKDCAKGISGQLQLTVTGPVKYVSSTGQKPPTVNSNVYTYEIADFGNINFTEDFALDFITDTTAKADDQICVNAQITPLKGDYNAANNSYDFCYSVINSHDPNLKEVYPVSFRPGYEGYFTYTIHFQNTGNAPAFNIRLLDTLDNAFDLTTFEVLNYSHANRVSLNGNMINVYFKNIQLQDSTTNEKESHGFIQYRIKPKKAVSESDQIKNTAHIYFDFNEAVVTNTTLSKANKSLAGLEQMNKEHFVMYPNPAKNVIYIENITSSSSQTNFVITDIQGKVVSNTTSNFEGKHSIDVSNFTNGVYFIKVENDNYSESVRFVKL